MFEHCDWIGVQRASPLGSTSFWVLLLVSTNSARPPSGEVSAANSYSLQVAAVGQGGLMAARPNQHAADGDQLRPALVKSPVVHRPNAVDPPVKAPPGDRPEERRLKSDCR